MNNNSTTYQRLGDYIREVDVRNSKNEVNLSQGICNQKYFQNPRQVSSTPHLDKIVRKGQFAYNRATTRNGNKISIAYREGEDCTVSSAYCVFYITDENQLNPYYLWLWFKRPDFDRYAIFKSHGSAHEFFEFETLCNTYIPMPPLDEQRRIVSRYQAIQGRIAGNKQTIAKLEEAAQALYRKMFVDDIDVENLPEGWRRGTLGEVCDYHNKKIDTSSLLNETYISTENLLKDKKGITIIDTVPDGRCNEFKKNMILLSNIRPYFKKLWKATFNGGCSADVLCFVAKERIPSDFLFYTMAEDSFFDYVVSGSNGVKMPRGDKDWTIKYPIVIPNENTMAIFQKSISVIADYKEKLVIENKMLTELLSVVMA